MSVNRYRPHVLVLPEDDANRQLANGFSLNIPHRQLQVLEEVGGWSQVRDCFVTDHVASMQRNPERFMVLLLDFDEQPNRLENVKSKIPPDLAGRVFVIGSLKTPEALRQEGLGTYEEIGQALANDCRDGTEETWGHELLQNNAAELARLREAVCDILFP